MLRTGISSGAKCVPDEETRACAATPEMNDMRTVVYARYFSDLQREMLIDDQFAVARRYVNEGEWTVLEDDIYTDAGISGASIQGRAGAQRLLTAAAHQLKAL